MNKKILGLLSLFYILWIIWVPWQTQDGPNHQKVAIILSRLGNSPVEAQTYESNLGFFQTNELFPLLYQFYHELAPKLSIQVYEKLFVALSILLLWWAYRYFLKVWSPQSQNLEWLVLPLSFHLLFVQGMYNFMACVPLTLLTLAWLKCSLQSRKVLFLFLFMVASYLAFLAHPFPSFIVLPALLIVTLKETNKKIADYSYLLSHWLIALGFFFLGFIRPLFQESGDTSLIAYHWKMPWENLGGLFAFNFPLYSVLQALGLIPFFLLLVFLGIRSLRTTCWKDKIFWIGFLVLYFIFPNEGKGGAHLNLRFLPFVWLFLPLGLVISQRLARKILVLSLITIIYLGACVTWAMVQLQKESQEVQIVMSTLPHNRVIKLYPINFDLHGSALNYTAQMHLWAHYPEDRIVLSPYLFAFSKLMPLSKSPLATVELPATDENFAKEAHFNHNCLSKTRHVSTLEECEQSRQIAWDQILSKAKSYDYWWVHQPPQDFLKRLQELPALSLVAKQGRDSLWVFKNNPVPIKGDIRL